jgi:hypothetical protein
MKKIFRNLILTALLIVGCTVGSENVHNSNSLYKTASDPFILNNLIASTATTETKSGVHIIIIFDKSKLSLLDPTTSLNLSASFVNASDSKNLDISQKNFTVSVKEAKTKNIEFDVTSKYILYEDPNTIKIQYIINGCVQTEVSSFKIYTVADLISISKTESLESASIMLNIAQDLVDKLNPEDIVQIELHFLDPSQEQLFYMSQHKFTLKVKDINSSKIKISIAKDYPIIIEDEILKLYVTFNGHIQKADANIHLPNWHSIFVTPQIDETDNIVSSSYRNHQYVAFQDFSDSSGRLSVLEFNKTNNQWQILGRKQFSYGRVNNISLAIDNNGIPYVSFVNESCDGKAYVMYYNTIKQDWDYKGEAISNGLATYTSIAIDRNNNTPYIAFSDHFNNSYGSAKVVFYDNESQSWQTLGSPIGRDNTEFLSLAISPAGDIFLAFNAYGFYLGRTTVVGYDKQTNSWKLVGNAAISKGVGNYNKLAINSQNQLYLMFSDLGNDGKSIVTIYDKKSNYWYTLDDSSTSDNFSIDNDISISADNIYISFIELGNNKKLRIMYYNYYVHKWVDINSPEFINAEHASISTNDEGRPYVAFSSKQKLNIISK